jgi:hypothetical protein
MNDSNKLIMAVVRGQGKAAELRVCLELFVTFCIKAKNKGSLTLFQFS